ncbi:FUSC family protein [Kineosporia sp. J2-2]|uniref:FUSC family protein n=1 Tax=Kineosporia corallincola TaxID=2835133 RepID=A0ABS5THB7_9ACTN|nr:FUSC family protein [Kineosporia corallincola]MBT0770258.1 FUSC family protein [Kineosporia corallincola]
MTTPIDRTPSRPMLASSARFVRECWTQTITVRPRSASRRGSAQVALSVALPLAVLLALHRSDLTACAVFGSLNSVYGKTLPGRDRLITQARAGLMMTAVVVIGTAAGMAGPAGAVLALSIASVAGPMFSRRYGWLPNPALFLVFAVATLAAEPHPATDLLPAALIAAASAASAMIISQGIWCTHPASFPSNHFRPLPLRDVVTAPGARTDLLLHALTPSVAALLAWSAGFGHPYWAAVAATVPLAGTTLAGQVARGVHRSLGTAFGVMAAYVLLAPPWPVWLLVAAIGVLQFLTETFVARNYGIAVFFITPMALTLSHLGAVAEPGQLIIDRMMATALGICVALLLLTCSAISRSWDFP